MGVFLHPRMRWLICLLALASLPFISAGQFEPSYRHLSASEGLPSNTIYDIIQGPNGEIVIGHQYGLSRYNGLEVSEIPGREQPPALSNLVMIGTSRYLCRSFNDEIFLVSGNRLHPIDSLSNKRVGYSTFFRYACHMYRSKANRISIVCDGMIPQDVTVFQLPEEATLYSVTEHKGHVYATALDSLYEIDLHTFQLIKKLPIGTEKHQFCYALGDSILLFKPFENKLHFVTDSGLSDPFSFQGYNVNHKVNFIRELESGITAIGTYGGLYLYDQSFQLIGNYFSDKQISCMTTDKENNLWLGTLQDGILIIPSREIKSLKTDDLFGERSTISKLTVLSNNLIAIGTFQGKLGLVDEQGRLKHKIDMARLNEVQSIHFSEAQNKLYMYCQGLIQINSETFKVEKELSTFPVKSISVSGDTIFCGTSSGLQVLIKDQLKLHVARELWVRNILPYDNGLLLETPSGVHFFDRASMKIEHHSLFSEINMLPNPSNFLEVADTIFYSSNGNIHYIHKNNSFDYCKTTATKIRSLAHVDGQLYASDNRKIYNSNGNIIDQTKGLSLNEIVGIQENNGHLLAYNTEHVQVFEKQIPDNSSKPRLVLREVSGSFDTQMMSEFADNILQITYEILPSISAQGNTKLSYQLTGEIDQSDTLVFSEQQQLTFERLPYGEYSLVLTAINEDGLSSKPKKLNLTVKRPYYATWWFRSSVLIVIVLLAILIIRLRIRIIKKKHKEKLEKERLKTHALLAELKAIRSQMDPHFIFNCLSSIQSSILNNESETAYENLTVFTKLLREALLFTSREFITLEEEIGFIKKYVQLEQMRHGKPFEFELKIDPALDTENTNIPSLITQPFVENAIRHGLMHKDGNKKLELNVQNSDDAVKVQIIDNGVGIETAKAINAETRKDHQSTGIKAIHDRINLLNERGYQVILSTQSSNTGTTVEFTFKSKK